VRCRGARAYVPIGGAGAVLAQKILSQAPAPLPANSAVSLAMEDVIAGCLEKDRSQRRQRVQNAMIELKLAGRSLPRSGEAHRRLPERPTPAPVAAASGTTHGPLRPAPRITVARPSVAPYAAQGSETIYSLSFTRRTWVIGGAILVVATLVAVVLFLERKPAPAVLKFAVAQPENTSYPGMPSVSPDGRDGKWLAYQSDASGRNEVYVQSFDGFSNDTKRRWKVSKDGGLPHWRSDSRELFYMTSDGRVMSVSIRVGTDGGLESGQPQKLFQARPLRTFNLYDATPDGQRFLVNIPLEWTSALPITVVTNWTEKLKQ
jgi:hypothetical protein